MATLEYLFAVISLIIALSLCQELDENGCPLFNNTHFFNGTCFWLHLNPLNWSDSRDYCASHGGTLASVFRMDIVTSFYQWGGNNYLFGHLSISGRLGWLGATFSDSSGLQWIDGLPRQEMTLFNVI